MECAGKGSGSRCLGPPRKRCGSCEAVAYCSAAHQILHWKQHRQECERLQQQMKHLDLLNDFPFTFSQEARTQISEKRECRCSFLSKRDIHRVGMWICECSWGAISFVFRLFQETEYEFPELQVVENLSESHTWNLSNILCPCCGPSSPIVKSLCSWKDYYEWRCIPLHSPVALLLHWGCDALILLDDSSSTSERFAGQNNNSVRGFEVIDQAKADILAVAARDASEYVGGPCWTVKLGRRDSTSAASASLASSQLPCFTDDLKTLIDRFKAKGFSERDMVALSGSHTIGQARCVTFWGRIYSNGSDIDAGFASTRRRHCPATRPDGDANLAPLDLVTPNSFDNNYFKNLLRKKGLLQSDQVLLSGGSTDSIVIEYSKNPSTFSSDFAAALVRMGDIENRFSWDN
ncbi:hypothetical protein PTKIN_Ptkin17bG0122300 [Pterospermum kingtungense]